MYFSLQIRSMLTVDANQRIKPADALSHEFFKQVITAPSTAKFHGRRKFRVSHLPLSQLTAITLSFESTLTDLLWLEMYCGGFVVAFPPTAQVVDAPHQRSWLVKSKSP